jgi:hypothetical protein
VWSERLAAKNYRPKKFWVGGFKSELDAGTPWTIRRNRRVESTRKALTGIYTRMYTSTLKCTRDSLMHTEVHRVSIPELTKALIALCLSSAQWTSMHISGRELAFLGRRGSQVKILPPRPILLH